MEHVEEAGVHSGDSACVVPPPTLSAETIEVIEGYTRAIADALEVKGPLNVQFAVQRGRQRFVPGVRDRGQPPGQPHGAVRLEGHRGAAGQGGGPGHGRRHSGRAPF